MYGAIQKCVQSFREKTRGREVVKEDETPMGFEGGGF